MIEPGTLIDGRYVVERSIASGGMGTVVLVRHKTLDSLHALKILHVPGKDIRERLLMEGRVQAKLKHPNIVAVTDTLVVDGSPGIVMEFVEGGSLEEQMTDNPLSWKQAEPVFLGILAGVHHAHVAGLVHRDLKPANVLLARLGDGILPKVADFGIVKVLAEAQEKTLGYAPTRTGIGMGTPQYMAPEQGEGASEVGPEADVFSLGCILYELTCGRRPFEAKSMLGILAGAADGMFDDPEDVNPDLPKPVVEAIRGALVPDREHRIQDCVELARIMTAGRVRTLTGVPQSHNAKPTDTVPLGRFPRGLGSIEQHRASGRRNTWTASVPPSSQSNIPAASSAPAVPQSQAPDSFVDDPPRQSGRILIAVALTTVAVALLALVVFLGVAIAGAAGFAGATWWAGTPQTAAATDDSDSKTGISESTTPTDSTDDTDVAVDPVTTVANGTTTATGTNVPNNTGTTSTTTKPKDTGTATVSTTTKPKDTGTATVSTTTKPKDTGTATVSTTTKPVDTGTATVSTTTVSPEWALRIRGHRTTDKAGSGLVYKAKSGHLLLIDVTLTNGTSRSFDALSPFRLRSGGKVFEASGQCNAMIRGLGSIVEVRGKRATSGVVCFEVPTHIKSGTLEFRPTTASGVTAKARF